MVIRFAKKSDAKQLAQIHFECGKIQPDGFMHNLGMRFLITYYRIIISECNSVILLVEEENRLIQGFCSGTLSAEEHLKALKKHKFQLALSLIPVLLKSPILFKHIFDRLKFIKSSEKSVRFGVSQGSRCEYWAWRPENKNLTMSIHLFSVWRNVVFELGYKSIKGEVDTLNKYILKIHKILGAKVIAELKLPDGRNRVIIEYVKVK